MARKCLGRKRVVLQKVEDPAKRQVTFTKRRGGLFKKSSELCTLVGAEVAILAFSPGGKVFSFGHPSVDTIIDRYLGEGPDEIDEAEQFYLAHRSSRQLGLNKRATELEGLIADGERQSRETDQMMRQMFAQRQCWWEKDYWEFSYKECEAFEGNLHRLKDFVMQLGQVNNQDAPASNQLNHAEAPFSSANGVNMDTRALPDQFNGSIVPFEPAHSGAYQFGHVVPHDIFADHDGFYGSVPYEPVGARSGSGVPVDTEVPWLNGESGHVQGVHTNSEEPALSGQANDTRALKGKAPILIEPVVTGSSYGLSFDARSPWFSDQHSLYDPYMPEGYSHWVANDSQAPFNQRAQYEAVQVGATSQMESIDTETPSVFNVRGLHDARLPGSSSTGVLHDPTSHMESTDTETPPVFNMKALYEALFPGFSSTAVPDDHIGIKSSQEDTSFVPNWDPGFIDTETYNPVAAGATFEGGPSIDSGPLGPGGSHDNVASHEAGASFDASLSLSDFDFDLSWNFDDDHSSPNI